MDNMVWIESQLVDKRLLRLDLSTLYEIWVVCMPEEFGNWPYALFWREEDADADEQGKR